MRLLAAALLLSLLAPSLRAGAPDRWLVFLEDAPGFEVALRADPPSVRETLAQNHARARRALERSLGPSLRSRVLHSSWLANALVLRLDEATRKRLAGHPSVKRIEPPTRIALDPRVLDQDHAPGDPADRTWGLAAMRALEAREAFDVDGEGVVVGILDSGIDPAHPDLAGKVLAWKDTLEDRAEPYDDNGHGTHCAGTIAGGAATGRALGVAPGARLVVGKIFGSAGFAQSDWILEGMQWIADPDGVPASGDEPRLVSNSWGGAPGAETFREAVRAWRALGILPVFAAGNSGPGEASVGSPAGFPESLAVGATTVEGAVADFSSRGPSFHDGVELPKPLVAAPGAAVTSARVGGGTRVLSGTSMATPHVSGLAALLLEAAPSLSAEDLEEILVHTVRDRGPAGHDPGFGHGFVDAPAALAVAASGGRIEGRVLDDAGDPLPWAAVRLAEVERGVPLTPDASFSRRVAAGDHTLVVSAFGFEDASALVTVPEDGSAPVEVLMLRRPSGTLRVRLRDVDGTAVEGALRVPGSGRSPFPVHGEAEIRLPLGAHALAVDAFGFATRELPSVDVPADGATLEVTLERLPGVLLVDDAGGATIAPWFTTALEDLDLGYRSVRRDDLEEGFTARELTQYPSVIWFTGRDNREVLTRADMTALAGYLDAGGRLLLTGQEVGFEHGDDWFYRVRLRSRFVSDGTTYKTVTGAGLAFAIEGGDGADNQWFPDELQAREGAETFLVYGDGEGAGVRFREGSGGVVHLGFGLEGVDTRENRAALLEEAFAYLLGEAAPRSLRRRRRFPAAP